MILFFLINTAQPLFCFFFFFFSIASGIVAKVFLSMLPMQQQAWSCLLVTRWLIGGGREGRRQQLRGRE